VVDRIIAANVSTFGPCGGDSILSSPSNHLNLRRSKGVGELYTYLPLTPNNREVLLAVPPSSKENSDYGFSVGRDAFRFDIAVGKWISLAFRVKLNSIGAEDGRYLSILSTVPPPESKFPGEVELWVDGKCVMKVLGLGIRDSENFRIKGAHFQTFFGGALFYLSNRS
jgi:hypothetical protein